MSLTVIAQLNSLGKMLAYIHNTNEVNVKNAKPAVNILSMCASRSLLVEYISFIHFYVI